MQKVSTITLTVLFFLSGVAGFPLRLSGAQAASFTVLYTFKGGSDGALPSGNLINDQSGNLYGVTATGGAGASCPFGGGSGCGTIFRIAPGGAESVLYSFCSQPNCVDGELPKGGLVMDGAGNIYGTTEVGGSGCSFNSCGTVFELATGGTESVLYAFKGGSDGDQPEAGLVMDGAGNLYGTTVFGGDANCQGGGACGTVFKVTPSGGETILHAFSGVPDGKFPSSALTMDQSGNMYGATLYGGRNCASFGLSGCGTVYEISTGGAESVLYSFCALQNCADGQIPSSTITPDSSTGNLVLYGTTYEGGSGCHSYGCGTVYDLDSNLNETVLHAFNGKSDGRAPLASVTLDGGALYSAACGKGCQTVGGRQCSKGCSYGDVFKITQNGRENATNTFRIVHMFNGKEGANPSANLLLYQGSFYGVTTYGGPKVCGSPPQGCGVVFMITP